ncbi:hypothetical protein YA0089_28290 [Pseudomonas viridiflava]|uniref:hypothetical protein n=1 Tax=Pseudomonas viridiflava TaxID=33069 RepID=UPI0018E640E6|nr:hypothetical protein [Pseudomonas viridiflava]MBI6727519.1 hypothetical protein [Pseudomonas viridiflava]
MNNLTMLQRANGIIHRAEAATYSSHALAEDAVALIKDFISENIKKDQKIRELLLLVEKGEAIPSSLISTIEESLSQKPLADMQKPSSPPSPQVPEGVPEGYKRIAIDEDLFHVDFCMHAGDILVWGEPAQCKKQKPNILRLICADKSASSMKKYMAKADKYKRKFVRIAAHHLSITENEVMVLIDDIELTEFLTENDDPQDFIELMKQRQAKKVQSN